MTTTQLDALCAAATKRINDYIAACNPDAMSKVLAHIEAQQAEN
jgi:hypothetical protein